MHKMVIAGLIAVNSLTLFPVASSYAQASASVCGTGPYVFAITTTGVLPSVGKQIAALGLMAKIADCTSFKVVCAVRPSTTAADKKAATDEANKACGAIRTKLLKNITSRTRVIAASLNAAARKDIEIIRRPASSALPAGTAMVYVEPQ